MQSSFRPLCIALLLALITLSAGCSTLLDDEPLPEDVPVQETISVPRYQVTIAQPDARSDYIHMDSDVYNAGEVVEFVVTNDGLLPLACSSTPPDFRVVYQTGSGRWTTRMGAEGSVEGKKSSLAKGESTQVYRFVTTSWDAGRYRIISDCGVERDILIRVVRTPAPTPAPTICPPSNTTGAAAWITIEPVPAQTVSRPFMIRGTTNIPAGTELGYSIFAVTEQDNARPIIGRAGSFVTVVQEGACGINTWSAEGEIQAAGEFFIGIENQERTATAIKRFTVNQG